MIFIDKIQDFLSKYESRFCGAKDKAFLYGICNPTPPLADHIVFEPLPESEIKHLVNDYKHNIPEELLTLYRFMNGADLFWTVRILGKNVRIPFSRLSVYGVPLTFDRKHIEPYSIRIEDLNRPDNTPESWLKFGSYYKDSIIDFYFDLFVDTETLAVFAVKNGESKCCIEEEWSSIDCCLCSLLERNIR